MRNSSTGDRGSCPSRAELAAFLSATLPAADLGQVRAHVAACEACSAALRRMDAPTTGPETARLGPGGVGVVTPTGYGGDFGPPRTRFYPLIRPQHQPPPARLGQYRLIERLGAGGMGAVYRAEHVKLKRDVAVKVLSPGQATDPRTAARFQVEMEVVGRLDHPHLVRATDAGEAEGFHFLVMELIDGVDLSRVLARRGPLAVADACEAARQAAVGLQAAHDAGLVHRDVKPSNLMVTAAGGVKVLDLGLALLRSGGPPAGDLTAVGEVMGTAEYMAPEQTEETHAVDGRADVYSLGCTLYALLTGDPPFTSPDRRPFAVMAAHQFKPVPPVADRRPDVPPELAALLGRMLAKRPDDRPATPGGVAAELERLAAGANLAALAAAAEAGGKTATVLVHPPTPPVAAPTTTAYPPRRSRRRWYAAVAALAVASVAFNAGRFVPDRPAPGGPAPASAGEPAPPPPPPPDRKRWRRLLAQPLGEQDRRLWRPAVAAVFDHNLATESLSLQTTDHSLVRLGAAPAGAYRLEIGLQQVRWDGGVGVYLGGRTVPPGTDFVFQYIRLNHTGAGPNRQFALTRGRGIVSPGVPGVNVLEFATHDIPSPAGGEHLLELEPQPNGLAVVRWNGIPCTGLTDRDAVRRAANLFPDGGLHGEFGVYCNGAAVTVPTARFLAIE